MYLYLSVKKLAYFLGIYDQMYHFFLSKYFYSFLYSWFHISTKNNFLIIGPRGSGKTSLVYLWSGYINAFLLEVKLSYIKGFVFKESYIQI